MKFYTVGYHIVGDCRPQRRLVIADTPDDAIGKVQTELQNADLNCVILSVTRVREYNVTAYTGKGVPLVDCLSIEDRMKLDR